MKGRPTWTKQLKICVFCALLVCCAGQSGPCGTSLPSVPTAQELPKIPPGLPELPELSWGEFRLQATELQTPTCAECLETQAAWDEWNNAVDPEETLEEFGERFAEDPIDALANVAFVATYYFSGAADLTTVTRAVNEIFQAMGGCNQYCDNSNGTNCPPMMSIECGRCIWNGVCEYFENECTCAVDCATYPPCEFGVDCFSASCEYTFECAPGEEWVWFYDSFAPECTRGHNTWHCGCREVIRQ